MSVTDIGTHSTLLERFHNEEETNLRNDNEDDSERYKNYDYTSDEEGSSIFRGFEDYEGGQIYKENKNNTLGVESGYISEDRDEEGPSDVYGERNGQFNVYKNIDGNHYEDDYSKHTGFNIGLTNDCMDQQESGNERISYGTIEESSLLGETDFYVSDISLCLVEEKGGDNVRHRCESLDEYSVGHGVDLMCGGDIVQEGDIMAIGEDVIVGKEVEKYFKRNEIDEVEVEREEETEVRDNEEGEEGEAEDSEGTLQDSQSTLHTSQLSAISICTITNHPLEITDINDPENCPEMYIEGVPSDDEVAISSPLEGLGDSLYSDCGVPLEQFVL